MAYEFDLDIHQNVSSQGTYLTEAKLNELIQAIYSPTTILSSAFQAAMENQHIETLKRWLQYNVPVLPIAK